MKWGLLVFSALLLFACAGESVRYSDDFRQNTTPFPLEPRPTFNADSSQYVGDKAAGRETTEVDMPEVDGRHPMPELPDRI